MTSAIPEQDAREFGLTLRYAGFHPFPSVNEHGELVDIRMWRWFPDIVEFVTIGSSEFSFAGRVHSAFDYRRPFEHGHVVALQHGHVFDVTRWLLDGTTPPHPAHTHTPILQQEEPRETPR